MMNSFPSKDVVEARKARYKPGSRVELVSMNDPHTTLKPGDRGFVTEVDDIGTVHIRWDSGSALGAAYGADQIKIVPYINDAVFDQIMNIRNSGDINMFDSKAVFELAIRNGYDELADFIFSYTPHYGHFVLTGER